jgi:predicted nucleic acid-binding protein
MSSSSNFARCARAHRYRAARPSPRISSERTATAIRAVLDASALVRGTAAADDPAAETWLAAVATGDVEGLVPDLAFAEAANAFRGYVRAGDLAADDARAKLALIVELPLKVASLRSLVLDALATALDRGVSVYDACYIVLAETADAPLVTADAQLARAATRAALLPDARPPTSSD